MIKNDPNRSILKDHKKEGKKLIPPLMQNPNVRLVSFRNNMLPCLIWISAFFVRNSDKDAMQKPIKFLIRCNNVLSSESTPPLMFLNNFSKLSNNQKKKLCDDSIIKDKANFIWRNVCHQAFLFNDYPLSFLFKEFQIEISKGEAIRRLKEDILGLLDRHCEHAKKVQVAAIMSRVVIEEWGINPDIDPNSVFTSPNSNDAKEFTDSTMNHLNRMIGIEGEMNEWAKSFWCQIFKLEDCQ